MQSTNRLLPLIRYRYGQICSRLLHVDGVDAGNDATLFVMDADESISAERAGAPRLFIPLDGELLLVAAEPEHAAAAQAVRAGEAAAVPAGVSHAIYAASRCAFIQLQGGRYMESIPFIRKLPQAEAIRLADQLEYAPGQLASMTLVQRPELGVTLFAVDRGQHIRRHVTPGDALVQVLDGTAEIEIGEARHTVQAGEAIVMPAHIPHALYAEQASFKMLLVVVKAPAQQQEGPQ